MDGKLQKGRDLIWFIQWFVLSMLQKNHAIREKEEICIHHIVLIIFECWEQETEFQPNNITSNIYSSSIYGHFKEKRRQRNLV